MNATAHPLGLHVHLVASGSSLRFVVWFERAAGPLDFKTFKGYERDVPFLHPYAVPHDKRPKGLPAELLPGSVAVTLPRLGSFLPIPLPGLIAAWDLAQFKTAARVVRESPYIVPVYVVPPSLSLHPLRKLVHDWGVRYGAGFVSPHAGTVIDVLDTLRARLAEGPLLPSRVADTGSEPRVVWTPPMSLAELTGLDASLRRPPRLAAGHRFLVDRYRGRVMEVWTTDKIPSRFANFVLDVFGAAVDRSGGGPAALDAGVFRTAGGGDRIAALHQDHGSCLYPQHPVFAPAPSKAHLHGRMHPMDAPDAHGNTWEMELGIVNERGDFASVDALVAEGTLAHPMVERDGVVWSHPASIIERDWGAVVDWRTNCFSFPELLTGRCRLTEAAGLKLLSGGVIQGDAATYAQWLEEIGSPGRPKPYPAFSASPARGGAARVKVHWDLAGDDDPSLHAVRFAPRMELVLGDLTLTADEAESIVRAATAAFVRVHGRVVGRDDLAAAVELLRAREKVLQRLDAPRGIPWHKAVELDDAWTTERAATLTETVFAARWEAFLTKLRDGAGVTLREAPEGFRGTLRPYQVRGLSWLAFVVERGFGGCLADDMGLGKTVQVLALLALRRRDEDTKKRRGTDLVVCPTAVVLNWAREAKKFTPGLRVHVHQGGGRAATPEALRAAVEASDVVVTSYPLVRRDRELFEPIAWGTVVVDEAQNLKNPDALQTRAVRSLVAEAKVCLTGTPVENHLRDLWSIFDVALPGLLGGPTRFARTFLSPVRTGDPRAMERLTRRVGPFLLRRTKADPGVAADLPPKQEQETFCDLTREQAVLYRAMTDATLEGITDKDGIARRAHILGALVRFKQICNHPENFQRDRPDKLFGRSGKLDRAMELLGELLEEDQRVLVFTQFTEMGTILQRAIAERLDVEADFYHGGLGAKAREAMVDAFNSPEGPPILLVSLRAGGTGLNLTAASAVIHYDRWWNPAVEDQATDRAHRIGQTRKVNVYKFVTRATLEERIVTLLESKRDLAARVLGSSDESWLTEMDDRSLRDFLTLGELTEES